MPLIGLYLLAALGVGLALCAPLELGLAAVLGAWMLVPAGLLLPGLFHIFTIDRVVLGAFAVRLVARSGHPGEPQRAAYRLTPLHGAWGLLLVVGYVDGVMLAPGAVRPNLIDWLTFVDAFVLFVSALAVLRTIGVWRVLRIVVVVVTVAAGIGIIERITGHGWANYLTEHVPLSYQSGIIFGLGTRGGVVRSQAASEFALELGWVLAMLLPLMAIAVATWMARHRDWGGRRYLLVLAPAAALTALTFTESRSAEVAVAVAAVVMVAAAGAPRRLTAAVVSAIVIVAFVGLVDPHLIGSPFTAAAHTNSIAGRLQRLPDLFGLVVHRPWTGLGYTGYTSLLQGLDDAYALTYGQLGVIGLLGWVVVLVATFATACRSLRAPRASALRELGAACAVGVVAVAAAAAAYDLTFTEQSMWTLGLLGAVAVALADSAPARPAVGRSPARLVAPLLGTLAGFAALSLAPVGFSETYLVYFVTPTWLAGTTGVSTMAGQTLSGTLCGFLAIPQLRTETATVSCVQPSVEEQYVYPEEIRVRIGGTSASAVDRATDRSFAAFRGLDYPTVAAVGGMQSGKPAWATTAPLSGAVAGGLLALVVPPLRRRPRRGAGQARP